MREKTKDSWADARLEREKKTIEVDSDKLQGRF